MFKQINLKLKNDTARIEFWIVTGCIALALLLSIIDVIRANQYVTAPLLFNYAIIFISYAFLCFYVAPAFENTQESVANNTLFVFVFISVCYLVGIINLYFSALLALKILLVFFNRNRKNKSNALYYEAALLTASWILLTVALLYVSEPLMLKFYFAIDVPVVIVSYLYAVHVLLPRVEFKRHALGRYLGIMLLVSVLSCFIVILVAMSLKGENRVFYNPAAGNALNIDIGNDSNIEPVFLLNLITQLFIVIPLARYIYKGRQTKKDEEIKTLKTELGKSDANLNFLKSQINPHFLFNALNTLYGTALQENAERTGEGIQKLGDMMRFMLQENTQDTIFLSRDIDYLNNYILLQKLRTSTSEDITIETQIEEYTGLAMITPMLLIPFVENAFKHGISLQNPSHIRITLQTKGDTLYFDVHNSIHIRHDNDPEKGQSGIGLENVKQRLNLLYPERHDLSIHQNAKEFFIHLTLQLASNN
ncbi:sensor histidine kinase [Mucilaginibacter dorajii]|uniref:Signal transduction histidine kinase internal region domain-containing protein n=1 Tax=Mucilaginibacter dorajii TaxID=692994 RepID=A0ABP7QD30_9SPHI|nr:histidine kinase [Mucilaginibacter dorajii]MCS3733238.1 hypothetical protein [Mucilaginibacter dorajii]